MNGWIEEIGKKIIKQVVITYDGFTIDNKICCSGCGKFFDIYDDNDLNIECRKFYGKKGDLNVCFDCDETIEKVNNETIEKINTFLFIPMKFFL